MPDNAFDLFMGQHPPIGQLVAEANTVLWDRNALDPVVKERVRMALAEAIGCSYCARFRTNLDGAPIVDGTEQLDAKGRKAEEFARAVAANEASDEFTVDMQQEFTPAEFADLVFSIGWFVGMQHVGRLMHWDDSCPVAPIRALVEGGEAA